MPLLIPLGTFGASRKELSEHWILALNPVGINKFVSVDPDLNVYIGSEYYPVSDTEAYLAKIDPFGQLVWEKSYRQSSVLIVPESFISNTAGIAYITSSMIVGSSWTGVLTKIDSDGNKQWAYGIPKPGSVERDNVSLDTSGNPFIAFKNSDLNSDNMVKYNSSGVKQSQFRIFHSSLSISAGRGGLRVLGDNNFYYNGTANPGSSFTDFLALIIKGNPNTPSITWQKQISTTSTEYNIAEGIETDSSGNVYALVLNNSDSSGPLSSFIIKFNSAGTLQWCRRILSVTGRGLRVSPSGNVYISGSYLSSSIILKYNSSGTLQWQRTISNIGASGPAIDIDQFENIYLYEFKSFNNLRLLKYPGDGSISGTFGPYTISASSATEGSFSPTITSSNCSVQSISLTATSNSYPIDSISFATIDRQGL